MRVHRVHKVARRRQFWERVRQRTNQTTVATAIALDAFIDMPFKRRVWREPGGYDLGDHLAEMPAYYRVLSLRVEVAWPEVESGTAIEVDAPAGHPRTLGHRKEQDKCRRSG